MKGSAVLLALFCMWSHVQPSQAQDEIVSAPGFDTSPLNVRPVAKLTPRPITSMDLLTMRDVKGMQISPDGKSVAYVLVQAVYETNSYRTALFVVGTNQGDLPVHLGSAGPVRWDQIGQVRSYVLAWSPDSQHITCLKKDRGTWQIWSWKRGGGQPEQLTHNSQDTQDYEWTSDGSKIIFTTSEPLSSIEAKGVLEQGILYDGLIRPWGHNTFPRMALEARPKKVHIWIYEFATRTERRASAEEESHFKQSRALPDVGPGNFGHALKLSPDRKIRAFAVSDAESKDSISIQPVDGGKQVQILLPSDIYISSLWWSKNTSEVFFHQLVDDTSGLYAVSVNGGAIRQVTTGADFFSSFSFDQNQHHVACVRYHTTLPPEIAVLDLKTGVTRTLAIINPEFQNIVLSPATKLEWRNKYGMRTYGYLVKPLDYVPGKRYPLIVTSYAAGGFLRGAAGNEYPIQVFAANGFAVLDFTAPPRQSVEAGDFEKKMMTWRSPMESLVAAVRMLDEMGVIDPNRTGLTGLSYGAEITEFTISHSNLFQAAATSGPGGRDPFFYYLSDNGYQKLFSEWGLGGWPELEPAATRWRELSPALNAERIKAPLLIQTADSELLPTLMLYNSLKEFGKSVEMMVYANEEHIKNQPKHKYEVYQRNLDWFNFWLQEKEDPDPNKAAQYKRWHELKKLQKKSAQPATSSSK